jgi:hypothetical protein
VTPREAALDYAARGWPVVVLHNTTRFGPKRGPDRARCSCSDGECESQGKHPRTRNGLKDSTTDPAVIEGWFDRWPDANIGLLTGVAFDVLDLDGDEAFDELAAVSPAGDDGLHGPIALTGRGVHMFVEPTGLRSRIGLLPGIDWKGTDGYVVAPPSVHYLHGDLYEWPEGFGPDRSIPPCPQWLADLVARRHVAPVTPVRLPTVQGQHRSLPVSDIAQRRIDGACGRVAMAPDGQRNSTLNWAANTLGRAVVDDGLDLRDVVAGLTVAAMRAGLGERETTATIRSGLRAAGVGWGAVA